MSDANSKTDESASDQEWQVSMRHLRQFPFPANGPFVSPGMDAPDGEVKLGWDQNKAFPAYLVGDELVPFTPLAQIFPENAPNYAIDNFTDSALKKRWNAADASTKEAVRVALGTIPPEHQFRSTGTLDPRGLIDPHDEVDLHAVRRPRFFGEAPWNEPIAVVDNSASIVEIEVPQGPYERMHLGLSGTIKVRGWHIAGAGVPGPDGTRKRALVILTAGRSIETTAIEHPEDPAARFDTESTEWVQCVYPGGKGTECFGSRGWRNSYILPFVQAGFDVLTLDKRGHGISGGVTDSNANEQAYDVLRILRGMESGEGLRVALPDGTTRQGSEAAGLLMSGYRTLSELPVFLGGASQGCLVSIWATLKLLGIACDFDRPEGDTSEPPTKVDFKGALLMAAFAGGMAYRSPQDSLQEAARRVEFNTQMFPSSETFASIPEWPGLLILRGLWDFAESIEGSLAAYKRATGPRALVTVRGPHGESEWGRQNMAYAGAEMVRFCTAVLHGQSPDFLNPQTVRDLVEAAPPDWSPFSRL